MCLFAMDLSCDFPPPCKTGLRAFQYQSRRFYYGPVTDAPNRKKTLLKDHESRQNLVACTLK